MAGVLGSEKATEEYGGGGIGQGPALDLERIGRGTVNASARQTGRTALERVTNPKQGSGSAEQRMSKQRVSERMRE